LNIYLVEEELEIGEENEREGLWGSSMTAGIDPVIEMDRFLGLVEEEPSLLLPPSTPPPSNL
jgi:hypothetical protein